MTKSGDRETPAPVLIYKPTLWDPTDGSPVGWTTLTPLPNAFRLIHDVEVIHSTNGGLDKALVAGREGISMMWMDEKTEVWHHSNVGTGVPQSRRPFANPYWGSGSVATARVGNDSVGYIASCEVSLEFICHEVAPNLGHRLSTAILYQSMSSLAVHAQTVLLPANTGGGLLSTTLGTSSRTSVRDICRVFDSYCN